MSGLKTTNKQFLEEQIPYGCYLWEMPDNQGFIADEEGRHFMIFGAKNDHNIVKTLREAVRSEFGIEVGRAVFMAGHRPVDDDEYANQKTRMKLGLQPDEHDLVETWDRINGRK